MEPTRLGARARLRLLAVVLIVSHCAKDRRGQKERML